ncbi:MAG: DUF2269 family protein [Chloroflexi bacterium]|nr:DUF2269 family protein [Chloroflexota bacterium]
MPELFPWFLLLHVLGAIIAFGPTFAFGIIGAMGGREPMHANFATRVSQTVSDRLVEPLALSMAVTGVGLIWSAGINPFAPDYRWLLVAIAIYLAALTFSFVVQRPIVKRIVHMTGGEGGGPPPMPADSNAAAAGPPPALASAVAAVQRNGIVLTVALVAIVFLMVVKPSLGG